MPVTVPGIMGSLMPNLASVAVIGIGMPKYARGVALGLTEWVPQIRVNTIDTGTAGSGKNVPLPLFVPTPILYANLLAGMAAQKLIGVVTPAFIMGLTNGLALAFGQMLVNTFHPSVAVGGGVAKFTAPPAARSMISGFQRAGLKGPTATKKARALGQGLDMTFASLVLPVVIVGPSSPFPGAGSGSGGIL